MANSADFDSDWMREYSVNLVHEHSDPIRRHRLIWQLTYLQHIVNSQGLCSNSHQIGFNWASNADIMSGYFANKGCRVTVSNMDFSSVSRFPVRSTPNLTIDDFFVDGMVSRRRFNRLVNYIPSDMHSALPDSILGKYDFAWAGHLENLGSVSLAQRFVINSLEVLKPGGIAVHFIELTLSSNVDTFEVGKTTVWRKRDIEQVVRDAQILGYHVFPLQWGSGIGHDDVTPDTFHITHLGYHDTGHIKLALFNHVVTTFCLILQRPFES